MRGSIYRGGGYLEICVDHHVHSEYSFCSEDVTMERLAELARSRGVQRFFLTDHTPHFYFDRPTAWSFKYLEDPSLLQSVREAGNRRVEEYIDRARRFYQYGMRVGLEVDYTLDGMPIIDPRLLEQVDLVIGSVHWLPCLRGNPTLKILTRQFIDQTLKVLEQPIDILGHPTRVFRRAGFPVPKDAVDIIIEGASERGIPLELNSHSKDPDAHFVRRCLERGAKIAVGTDSHVLREFGDFSYHKAILRECGVMDQRALEEVIYRR
ncbi:MAG: PHP domain-containing protein [bacterium]